MIANEFENAPEDVVKRVRAVMRGVFGIDDIPLGASLADIGVGSLSFIRMVVDLEHACEMRFDDDDIDLARFQTVDDVVRYVVGAGASAGAGQGR